MPKLKGEKTREVGFRSLEAMVEIGFVFGFI